MKVASKTTNYNFHKIDLADSPPDISLINPNWDEIDRLLKSLSDALGGIDLTSIQRQLTQHLDEYTGHVPYVVDSGTANAKVVTLNPEPSSYFDGMAISFKNAIQNTGAVTINVNELGAKSIVKSNGNALTSGNLKANSVYTLRYNGTSFFLQGEGGEYGTATASHVLEGYSYGTDEGVQNGSMPNRGAVNQSLSANGTYTIPAGYHNGSGKVSQSLTTKSAATITPGTTNQTIAANQYLTGVQTILGDTDLIPSNIRKSVNIFGVVGTLDVTSLGGKLFASGEITSTTSGISVRGISFTPLYIIIKRKTSTMQNTDFAIFANSSALSTTANINAAQDSSTATGPYAGHISIVTNGFDVSFTTITANTVYSWVAIG